MSEPAPLRLMVYDKTCRGKMFRPGLSHAWWTGAKLYRMLRRFDAYHGVTSWNEAFDWLASFRPDRPIAEVQYWGHGKWGGARVDQQVLDGNALLHGHELNPGLQTLRDRLLPGHEGLLWFRTCETFGARPGQQFARDLSDFLGSKVAGHTFIIGHVQSGLHTLAPGGEVDWDELEGLREGSPDSPKRAYWSSLRGPNTITCLRGSVPRGY